MLTRLVPSGLTGPQAVRLLDWFAEVERLAAAGKALVADRAAETNQWRSEGDRSPEHWLARRGGTTVGAAKDALDTARRLKELPATDAAVRAGELSSVQATAIAAAATADPDAESSLLDTATRSSVAELRRRCDQVVAAARSAEDERARHEAIRRSRSLRTRVAFDGAHELLARGTAEDIAGFWARLQPFIDAEFTRARNEERRESVEAYAFDALLAMSTAGGSAKSPAKMLIRVDLPALRRGTTAQGEMCEIAGYGPIPVSVAHGLMNEAFLALVLTKGKDVINVTHLGRQFTEHQKTALEWSDPECQVLGCASTVRLNATTATTGPTPTSPASPPPTGSATTTTPSRPSAGNSKPAPGNAGSARRPRPARRNESWRSRDMTRRRTPIAQRTRTVVRSSMRMASTSTSPCRTTAPGQTTERTSSPSTTAPVPITDAPPEASRLARR